MPTKIDVIEYPIKLPEGGIAVHEFDPLARAIENYLKNVRLPDYLHNLKIRIEARLFDIENKWTLKFILWHDGQLPLNFSVSARERRPSSKLLEELQHLKDTVLTALKESNGAWATAAQIINQGENPATDLAHFQAISGFQAPRKPLSKHVPSPLTLVASGRQLTLVSVDTRPEYTETHAQLFKVLVSIGSQGMVFKVVSFQNVDAESDFASQAKVGQDMRPRWPLSKDLDWHHYAGVAVMIEAPVDIIGFAVLSTDTLAVKAVHVKNFDVDRVLINRLLDTVQRVKDHEAGQ